MESFGAVWDTVALEIGAKFLVYILYRFSMAGYAILVALIIQNPIGTLGLSAAGIYLMVLTQNPMENSAAQDMFIAFIIKTVNRTYGPPDRSNILPHYRLLPFPGEWRQIQLPL